MKRFLYFLTIILIGINISCGDDEAEETAILGTLNDEIVTSNIDPSILMTAFEEEYANSFDFIDIDNVYFLTGSEQYLIGEGTIQKTDLDGNLVTGHIIARVPYEMDGNQLYITADNMNKGSSCSGDPCSHCAFKPQGQGCECLDTGGCNHTISTLTHGKNNSGGMNNIFEC